MATLKCKICGKEFTYEKESSCKAKLRSHIKIDHQMELEDYIVKFWYNGIHPMCPCGCGNLLHLRTGGKRWEFNKYATDSCMGRILKQANQEIKEKIKPSLKNTFDVKQWYKDHYDEKTFTEAFQMFYNKETPLTDVAKQYNIDKRTLKKVWIALGICTEKEITELTDFYRYNFVVESKGFIETESNNSYTWMYLLIKANPQKYTINSLVKYYNEKHDEKITKSAETVYKNLKRLYGDEIDVYLSYGFHSNEEFEFYQVLKFYFPEIGNLIILGKKFELSDGYIIYDYFINKTILIEYDSTGRYHKEDEKERDLLKEQFAKDNKYKFLRLTKDDIKNPETINKIKQLIYD